MLKISSKWVQSVWKMLNNALALTIKFFILLV